MLEYEKITKDLNLFKLLSDKEKLMYIEYIQMKENIEKQLFYSEASQRQWVVKNSLEPLDTYTEQYVKVFNFYKEASKSWVRFTTPWTSFLNPNYIDPPNGEHPNHPSREGHVLISDYVLCKIQETFPTIYQQWKISWTNNNEK